MEEPERQVEDSTTDPDSEVLTVVLPEGWTEEDRTREILARQAEGWRGPVRVYDAYLERVPPDAKPRKLLFSRRKQR